MILPKRRTKRTSLGQARVIGFKRNKKNISSRDGYIITRPLYTREWAWVSSSVSCLQWIVTQIWQFLCCSFTFVSLPTNDARLQRCENCRSLVFERPMNTTLLGLNVTRYKWEMNRKQKGILEFHSRKVKAEMDFASSRRYDDVCKSRQRLPSLIPTLPQRYRLWWTVPLSWSDFPCIHKRICCIRISSVTLRKWKEEYEDH